MLDAAPVACSRSVRHVTRRASLRRLCSAHALLDRSAHRLQRGDHPFIDADLTGDARGILWGGRMTLGGWL
jgi:hypothetical protein